MKTGTLYRVIQEGLDTHWSLYSDQKEVPMEATWAPGKVWSMWREEQVQRGSRNTLGLQSYTIVPSFLCKFLGMRLRSSGLYGKHRMDWAVSPLCFFLNIYSETQMPASFFFFLTVQLEVTFLVIKKANAKPNETHYFISLLKYNREHHRRESRKDARARGWGDVQQTDVFWTRHSCCFRELTASVVICARPAQGRALEQLIAGRGGAREGCRQLLVVE